MKIHNYILLLLILGSCRSKEKAALDSPAEIPTRQAVRLSEAQITKIGLETDSIRRWTMHTEVEVNGMVDVPPKNIVSISFPLGGYLKSTDLLPGMQVRRGEILARIEDPALVQLQQDFLVAQAKLKFLELDFERQKILNENEVNTPKQFQQIQADYTAQKVTVRALSEKLRLIQIDPEKLNEDNISRSVAIYSPINGFVSRVNVNIGKYVNPADVLFELINPDDIHAALTVFEKDLPLVKPGQKVKVRFVENPDKEYNCEVLLVTRNVDENRSALVHCHFENQPEPLLPGMFLSARIQVDNVEALTVPDQALVRHGDKEYLIEKTAEGDFVLLPVVSGISFENRVAITAANDIRQKIIVIKGAYSVLGSILNKGEE